LTCLPQGRADKRPGILRLDVGFWKRSVIIRGAKRLEQLAIIRRFMTGLWLTCRTPRARHAGVGRLKSGLKKLF
jgi:hypothetical protein